MIHIPRTGEITSCPMCGFPVLERVAMRFHNGVPAETNPVSPCLDLFLTAKGMEDEDAAIIRMVVRSYHLCRRCPCGYFWVERPATDRTAYDEPEVEGGS